MQEPPALVTRFLKTKQKGVPWLGEIEVEREVQLGWMYCCILHLWRRVVPLGLEDREEMGEIRVTSCLLYSTARVSLYRCGHPQI